MNSTEWQIGDVVLVRARPLAWRLLGLKYDHAALLACWPPETMTPSIWFTIEAGGRGVQTWPIGHWGRAYDVYRPIREWWQDPDGKPYPIYANAWQGYRAATEAICLLQAPYAWWDTLKMALRMIGRRVRRLAAPPPRLNCTGLVVETWRRAGLDWFENRVANSVTPDELAAAMWPINTMG